MSIPEIWIERVHLGEGTAAMKQAIEADPDAKARLEALAAADTDFHARVDGSGQLAAIERKLHLARTRDAVERRGSWRPLMFGLVPALAALTALLVVVRDTGPDETVVGERAKGSAKVNVFQRLRGRVVTVSNGEELDAGAKLQLGYFCKESHAALVSVDGRGTVTVHAPENGDTSIEPGRHLLDHAYALDDAPHFERFFLVCDDEPIRVDTVVDAAEDLAEADKPTKANLSLPGDARVADFLIKKVSP